MLCQHEDWKGLNGELEQCKQTLIQTMKEYRQGASHPSIGQSMHGRIKHKK